MHAPRFERILVPIDFSHRSRPTVQYALALAVAHGASIDLLHVWETPRLAGRSIIATAPREKQRALRQSFQAELEQALAAFLRDLEVPETVRVATRLENGKPAGTILEVASQGGYDLVVVSTAIRGRSNFFVGRVAENLVRLCPVPVLTVRIAEPAGAA